MMKKTVFFRCIRAAALLLPFLTTLALADGERDWDALLKKGRRDELRTNLWRAAVSGESGRKTAVAYYKKHAKELLPSLRLSPAKGEFSWRFVDGDEEWHDAKTDAASVKLPKKWTLPKDWNGGPCRVSLQFRPESPSYAKDLCRTNASLRIYPFVGDGQRLSVPPMPPVDVGKLENRWKYWNKGTQNLKEELREALSAGDEAVANVAAKIYADKEDLHPEVLIELDENVKEGVYVVREDLNGKVRPWSVLPGKSGKIGAIDDIPFGEDKDVVFLVWRKCEDPQCRDCSKPLRLLATNVVWSLKTYTATVPAHGVPPFDPDPVVVIPPRYLEAGPKAARVEYGDGTVERFDGGKFEEALATYKSAIPVRPHKNVRRVVFSFDRYREAAGTFDRKLHRGERFSDWGNLDQLKEKEIETKIVFALDPDVAEGADTKVKAQATGDNEPDTFTLDWGLKVSYEKWVNKYQGEISYQVFDGEVWSEVQTVSFDHGKENLIKVKPALPPSPPPAETDKVEMLFRRIVERRRIADDPTQMKDYNTTWVYKGAWKTDQNVGETAKDLIAHLRRPGDCDDPVCDEVRRHLKKELGEDKAKWTDDAVWDALGKWCVANPGKVCHGRRK